MRDHLKEEFDKEARVTLEREKKRTELEAAEKARSTYPVELNDTKAALKESKKATEAAQQGVLKVRKQARELQQQREQL